MIRSRIPRALAGWAARLLALLLIVVVAGQVTDLLPCGDESGTVTEAGGKSKSSGHDIPGNAALDCLCHVVFTRTDALPPVAAPAQPGTVVYADNPVRLPDVTEAPSAPVPLG